MASSLDGKRVLFFAPCFFGYYKDILDEIECRGAVVDWLPDRPFDTPFMKALTKLQAELVKPAASRLYDRMLCKLGTSSYDYIFVLNGQTLSKMMLRKLRSSYPSAKTILYMWDSIDNRKSVMDNLQLFDSVFTFDPLCAEAYGMYLRPLFYSRGFEQSQTDFDYHISFIGTAHTDRYGIVSQLRSKFSENIRAFWYLYLQAPWVFEFYRFSKRAMRNTQKREFNFVPLEKTMVQSVFSRSRAILDIEHPNQRGLTMRTIETLGAGKKLVTTNRQTELYDFFSTGNICVIERNLPRISMEFLESPVAPYSAEIRRKYSLAGWVDEVFDLQPESGEYGGQ